MKKNEGVWLSLFYKSEHHTDISFIICNRFWISIYQNLSFSISNSKMVNCQLISFSVIFEQTCSLLFGTPRIAFQLRQTTNMLVKLLHYFSIAAKFMLKCLKFLLVSERLTEIVLPVLVKWTTKGGKLLSSERLVRNGVMHMSFPEVSKFLSVYV